MKLIRKCPFFILLLSTGILFSIFAIAGKDNVYASQEYDPLTAPILSVMFTGINDEVYPWQVFDRTDSQAMAQADLPRVEPEGERTENMPKGQPEEDGSKTEGAAPSEKENRVSEKESSASGKENAASEKESSVSGNEAASENRTGEAWEPLKPLRESTYDEYINHISADIYGDAGVLRAAEYEFTTVEESYFDDALFIGDSRTVGLRDYTDLSEHGDFFCETSLTVYKVMEEDFGGKGTIEEALANKDYGKIYIMVGINELGRGTTEDFMAEYTNVVNTLHQLEPEAKIMIQGVMRVTGDKNSSDAIYNNSNINARNNAIATLADNKDIFYIDVNEVVCDEEGNLNTDYTFDQIHLLGTYNDLWKQFLLAHGVSTE